MRHILSPYLFAANHSHSFRSLSLISSPRSLSPAQHHTQESQEGLGAAERELDAVVVGRLGVRGAWFSPRSAAGRWASQQDQQARRKKMSRAQDGILKYMLKMMEACSAQGFVYIIVPENGKPVGGASDNLRAWWKEKVRFDRNAPAAIAKHQADNASPGGNGEGGESAQPAGPRSLHELQDTTLLSSLM